MRFLKIVLLYAAASQAVPMWNHFVNSIAAPMFTSLVNSIATSVRDDIRYDMDYDSDELDTKEPIATLLDSQTDFITPVRQISHDLTVLDKYEWRTLVHSLSSVSGQYIDGFETEFVLGCRAAALETDNIPSISIQETFLSDSLNRNSLIRALMSWSSTNPKSSDHFDQLILIFLKLYGPRKHQYSVGSYYYAEGEYNAMVVSFGPGHYITITDEISYISADGIFDEEENRAMEAVSLYLQCSDRVHSGRRYSNLRRAIKEGLIKTGIQIKHVNLSQEGVSKPILQQKTAIAVVDHISYKLLGYGVPPTKFGCDLPEDIVRDMITFVLSWDYKILQSDFEIDKRYHQMLKSGSTTSPKDSSMVDFLFSKDKHHT
ncbi:hypothetical protein NEOLI_003911 [Neolecta irregularis DAH-3]|uniref:Uncharacterized protein n=1 Tax=Neolecta irregularis (strain DAH-3) TaxID=1198029 RepID=A0A1U7LPP3_NEOID|nr:hypothetical protein NEOLI_003911 [Neolecta irregularis DAH-3]|eukprot:OLL24625.1 hypothetical protein NEOLI_003911 [Neolecta irregularis DAH-3]